jgi:hypothetical protein
MLKELVTRVALMLFIIGLATDAAHDSENSGAAKRQPGPGVKNASASTPGEIAS